MTLQTKPKSNNNIHMQSALSEIKKEDLVKLCFTIPKSMRSKFKIKAELDGTNMSELLYNYIKSYLKD